jgi:uncharacterized protein (TIGR02271 family)
LQLSTLERDKKNCSQEEIVADLMNMSSLRRLSDADFDVAPNEPDVRGWNVVLSNDEAIGEVDELIIDPAAGKVRYLDVELDAKTLGLEDDRHVLVPISNAQLDRADKEVVLTGLNREALLRLPEYDGTTFSKGYDDTFRGHLSKGYETKRLTRSAEELRIGKRVEQKGQVRVSKHVESDHVRQNVPVQREEVVVERRPVERTVGSARELRNDEISIPVTEEEVVVEKRPVVKEEVVIGKHPVTSQRTVDTDVRREEIDVNPSSDDVRIKDQRKNRGGA